MGTTSKKTTIKGGGILSIKQQQQQQQIDFDAILGSEILADAFLSCHKEEQSIVSSSKRFKPIAPVPGQLVDTVLVPTVLPISPLRAIRNTNKFSTHKSGNVASSSSSTVTVESITGVLKQLQKPAILSETKQKIRSSIQQRLIKRLERQQQEAQGIFAPYEAHGYGKRSGKTGTAVNLSSTLKRRHFKRDSSNSLKHITELAIRPSSPHEWKDYFSSNIFYDADGSFSSNIFYDTDSFFKAQSSFDVPPHSIESSLSSFTEPFQSECLASSSSSSPPILFDEESVSLGKLMGSRQGSIEASRSTFSKMQSGLQFGDWSEFLDFDNLEQFSTEQSSPSDTSMQSEAICMSSPSSTTVFSPYCDALGNDGFIFGMINMPSSVSIPSTVVAAAHDEADELFDFNSFY